jgi:hypothetical protein
MKKIIEWYKKSNRYKHAATGGIILAVFLLAGAVVAVDWFANLLLASGTVLVAMASAEYKDREHGSAFDWYDILAGMTLPVLFWVGSLIVLIVK